MRLSFCKLSVNGNISKDQKYFLQHMIFILNVGNEEEGPSADVKALLAWAKGKTYHKCRDLDIIFHKAVSEPLDKAPPEN